MQTGATAVWTLVWAGAIYPVAIITEGMFVTPARWLGSERAKKANPIRDAYEAYTKMLYNTWYKPNVEDSQ